MSALLLAAPERPAYTTAEASRYSRTSAATARRWLRGYDYETLTGRRHSRPVTEHPSGERLLSFYDLVEVAAVASAKEAGVSLQRIRAAIDYAKELLEVDRPLLTERFLTDGRSLYLREWTRGDARHINASEAGQIAFPHIEEVLRELDYEGERPAKWWPAGKDKPILVDPRVGFGQPILIPSGIRTETIVDRFMAGEPMSLIAVDYDLAAIAIEEALRFENRLGFMAA